VHTEVIPLNHTKIENERSTQSVDAIELYFGASLPVNRTYVQTHVLEIEGGIGDGYTTVLNKLKAEAFIYNADAIIQIERTFKPRQSEVLFSDEPPQKYTATVMNGICIKYTDNPLIPLVKDTLP